MDLSRSLEASVCTLEMWRVGVSQCLQMVGLRQRKHQRLFFCEDLCLPDIAPIAFQISSIAAYGYYNVSSWSYAVLSYLLYLAQIVATAVALIVFYRKNKQYPTIQLQQVATLYATVADKQGQSGLEQRRRAEVSGANYFILHCALSGANPVRHLLAHKAVRRRVSPGIGCYRPKRSSALQSRSKKCCSRFRSRAPHPPGTC